MSENAQHRKKEMKSERDGCSTYPAGDTNTHFFLPTNSLEAHKFVFLCNNLFIVFEFNMQEYLES